MTIERPVRGEREQADAGLVLNLVVQTMVCFGLMGAIIFLAAGTTKYPGGWIYLGAMIAISTVCGTRALGVDPGLLRERLRPPVQRDQPLADRLLVVPFLILVFGAIGFMAADAARWRWSAMPPSVQGAGGGLLLASFLFIAWVLRTNSFAAPVVKIQRDRGQSVITTGPYAIVRHPMYLGALLYIAGTSFVLGSWWGLATIPLFALLLGIRIGIEERTLRAGLEGYEEYARRVRWRLIPLLW